MHRSSSISCGIESSWQNEHDGSRGIGNETTISTILQGNATTSSKQSISFYHEQFSDSNATRSQRLKRDVMNFVGFNEELRPVVHTVPGQKYVNDNKTRDFVNSIYVTLAMTDFEPNSWQQRNQHPCGFESTFSRVKMSQCLRQTISFRF